MLVTVAGTPITLGPKAATRRLRAEVGRMNRPLRTWFLVTMAMMGAGVVAAITAIVPGKEVYGTNPVVEWGLLIGAYVFFATMTSGLCLASSLGTVFGIPQYLPLERRHAILALLSLVSAFLIIALDLHYPIRLVFGAILSPSPISPMWWMGVLYGGYLVFLVIEVWSIFWNHPNVHRYACVASSCMAIAAPSTLGGVFGVMVTRQFWHGAFTPASFLAFALMSGIALLGVVFYLVDRFKLRGYENAVTVAIPAIRLLFVIAMCAVIFLTIWQTLIGLYGGVPGLAQATQGLMFGPLAPAAWIVRFGIGLLIPAITLVFARFRTPKGLFVGALCALIGAFFDRTLFVVAGQFAPDTAAAGNVAQPYADYFPTLSEIGIVVGAAGFFLFAYTAAEWFLDLGHTETHGHGFGAHAHDGYHPLGEGHLVVDGDGGRPRRARPRRARPRRGGGGFGEGVRFGRGGGRRMIRTLRANALVILAMLGGLIGGGVAVGAVIMIISGQQQVVVAPTPEPLPSASGNPVAGVMDQIKGDCTACHADPKGGVGTKPIPPIGHPLEGWATCTSCHGQGSLVATAPGHTGIHATQCTICHTAQTAAADMRPHGGQNKNCLECHGKTAPLPDSMKNRAATTCWLCHRASDQAPPEIPHPIKANANCLECHTEGKIGAPPADHKTRMDTSCTQCHEVRNEVPRSPHSLAGLDGKCANCHASGSSPPPGASAGPSPTPFVAPAVADPVGIRGADGVAGYVGRGRAAAGTPCCHRRRRSGFAAWGWGPPSGPGRGRPRWLRALRDATPDWRDRPPAERRRRCTVRRRARIVPGSSTPIDPRSEPRSPSGHGINPRPARGTPAA